MNICYVEPFMSGQIHVPFNRAMLQVINTTFPTSQITIWAEKKHFDAIVNSDQPFIEQVTYKQIRVSLVKSGSKIGWFCKHIQECGLIVRALCSSYFRKPSLLVFSATSPIGVFFLNMLLFSLFRKQRVLVVLHSLAVLAEERQQKIIDRLYAWFLKKAFHKSTKNEQYIVMESSVANFLEEQGFLKRKQLIVIAHPYLFASFQKKLFRQSSDKPIRFVHLGIARKSKGSHQFFLLAERFKAEISEGKVLFQIVGAVLDEMTPYLNPYVVCEKGGQLLDIENYKAYCEEADYAVFLYEDSYYQLTSSGALLDAISYGLPILALKNRSFKEVFGSTDFPPGMLYDTFEELAQGIHTFIHKNKMMKEEFGQAFEQLRKKHHTNSVSAQLKEQLKSHIHAS